MNESLNQLPLILAGPILRRTQPDAVTVWIALRSTCTVTLTVLATEDRGQTISNALLSGVRKTVRLGHSLHIVAVTARSSDGTLLQPGHLYAYDLTFHLEEYSSEDSLENLDRSLQQALTSRAFPNAAISYFYHQLPTFSLPPIAIDDLHLVHGSCRKIHGKGHDTLPILDELIQQSAEFPNLRPHQLFLTGDQIYGDDVADPLLQALTPLGDALLGWQETFSIAHCFESDENTVTPEDLKPGERWQVAEQHAGLTASLHNQPEYAKSHLFSLGEYCGIYLFTWSPVLWSLPLRFEPAPDVNTAHQQGWETELENIENFSHTLWKVRRALANVPTYMIFDDHDVSDDWNLNQAWCLKVLGKELGRRVVYNALLAYTLFQAWGNTPDQFAAGHLGSEFLTVIEQWSNSQGTDRRAWETSAAYLGIPAQDSLTGLPDLHLDGDYFVLKREPQALTWHYTVPGFCHEAIVLDTRTWRGYPIQDKATAPPMLLSPSALEQQLYDVLRDRPNASNHQSHITILILPTNLFSLQLIDWIQQWNWKQNNVYNNDVGDAWNMNKIALAEFLTTLFKYRRQVVVLSGDIHYGSAIQLKYWTDSPASSQAEDPYKACHPCVLVQLTSSALKNSEFKTRLVHSKGKSFMPELDRQWIGWSSPLDVKEIPVYPGFLFKRRLQASLRDRSAPDWHYKIHWIPRQRAKNPGWGRYVSWLPLRPSHPNNPFLILIQPLKKLWLSRWVQEGTEVVGVNNIGSVQFQENSEGSLKAVTQDLYWYASWKPNHVVFSRFYTPFLSEKRLRSNIQKTHTSFLTKYLKLRPMNEIRTSILRKLRNIVKTKD